MAETLGPDQAQSLLDGIDQAFEAVLHGRYGGGISTTLTPDVSENGGSAQGGPAQDGDAQSGGQPQSSILRTARAGTNACICLYLQSRFGASGPGVDGIAIGTAQLATGANRAVKDISVHTEIFLDQDPNEAGDATALSSGVLLEAAPASLPNGGLLVVRSTEAARNHQQMALAEQQNWRPNPNRHVASSGLGASGRGHRQASPATLMLPVSADLLTRLGGVVAAVLADVGQVSVVLLPTGFA